MRRTHWIWSNFGELGPSNRNAVEPSAESLPERRLTVTRELTKVHEEVLRGTAAEVLAALGEPVRGEITLVISHERG